MNDTVNKYGDAAVSEGTNQFGDAPSRRNINDVLEFANKFAQGATFGWGDEISAAMAGGLAAMTGGNFSDAYDFALADIRGNMEQFEREHPVLSGVAEIGGGVTTGGAMGYRMLPGVMSPATSTGARYATIAGAGAAEGALYGAGASDDGRIVPSLQGALMGSVLAPAGTKVADWLLRGGRTAASFVGRKLSETPRTQAIRALRNAAVAEGIDADDAIRILDDLGPEATVADLGEEFRRLARAAYDQPGSFRGRAKQLVDARQMGQQDRLMRAAEVATGQRAGDFTSARSTLLQSRQDAARPLYRAAFDLGIETTDELDSILNRPAMKGAMRRAERMAQDMGEWDGELNALQKIHYAKMDLDRQISRAVRSEGRKSPQVRALMKTKTELLDAIGEQNPVYRQAMNAYAGESALIDAMDEGQNLFRLSADDMREMLSGMSGSERDMFQLGAMKALREKLDSTNMNADATRRLLGTKANRDRLGLIMDDPEEFIRRASAESEFTETRRAFGGSQTSTNLAGQEALEGSIQPELVTALATQDPVTAGASLIRSLSKNKVTPELVQELADTMLTKGMAPNKLLDIFSQPAVREAYGSTYSQVVLPAIAGAMAQTTGRGGQSLLEDE